MNAFPHKNAGENKKMREVQETMALSVASALPCEDFLTQTAKLLLW